MGIFVIGGIPKDLPFAVVNNDHVVNANIQDKYVEHGLPQYCTNFNESSPLPYSCLFLEKLTASTLNLVSYFCKVFVTFFVKREKLEFVGKFLMN